MPNTTTNDTSIRPSFLGAVSCIGFLCFMMFAQIFILGEDWVTHISLIFAIAVTAVIALVSGFTWHDIQKGILYGCEIAMLPMLILMMVGVLVASWIASGTIPSLVYYGLQLINPAYFLFTAVIVCAIASLVTGSSWTTAATFGVAFMGIGTGLDVPAAMTAGAVISGAIFGDKISPVSDSTNLAAGVAEADLFDHIRSMFYTTGPALVISAALFFFIGMGFDSGGVDTSRTDRLLQGIQENYSVGLLAFLPPLVVLVLAYRRVSALAVMVIGSLVGGAMAVAIQGVGIGDMMNFMNYGYVSETGVESVDSLLSRGGLQEMMWTISLGFIGLSLGGLLEKTRMLEVLLERMGKLVSNARGLIVTHVFAALATNLFSASQYIAIIIPGRMLVPAYRKLKILPSVCSRTCEDSATVTSPLVPWGLGGAYYMGVLDVSAWDYMGWTFLALITPVIAVLYAMFNLFIWREGERNDVNTYRQQEVQLG
ncbi:Na+/H+ antiporter NhaC [Halomonas rhizosphaerae]|uniref:Na+/H+ antiporter NhaC n=1 Tax=Halomonas rhizosphaerae TaxID=3043296 RepID=A0ABT6V4M7_9GAMM|nr:Na+/H+ antiporter NhaC [Halomonas rhizosphaerae]MDI5893196.1 Na+/H+ antiporter NhaC [Halomonas rhizosphaerae]MDI5921111.1 Na+/H+ antiporter NhaC [Halomonas rhizosphaerae]